MSAQPFVLVPFPAPIVPEVTITGTIARQDNRIRLRYILTGNLRQLLLPPASIHPTRKDELWKTTCFELFLAVTAQPPYWEINLSPSGDWNLYRMDAYRRVGFREEAAISQLPLEVRRELDSFALDVTINLDLLIEPERLLLAGIAAVIQAQDNTTTYWALVHPTPSADFHVRAGFTILLPGQQVSPAARAANGKQ